MSCTLEVIQNFSPSAIFGSTPAVTFVNNDQIEKIGREFPVCVGIFIVICKPLIQSQIDFISLVNLLMADNRHFVLERLEVSALGLRNQVIAICKEKNSRGLARNLVLCPAAFP